MKNNLNAQCSQFLGENGNNQASYTQVADLSLALDSVETPYIAYNITNGNKTIVKKMSGGLWTALDSSWFLSRTTLNPNIAVDKNGNPCITYITTFNKISVVRYSGGQWAAIGPESFSPSWCGKPKLIFDKYNVPHVIFMDGGNSNKISVMKYNGSSWVYVGSPGFSSGAANYLNLACDTSGNLYSAYRDETNGKATVMKYTGGNWVNVGSAGVSQGGAWFISLAIDYNGALFLAYSDSMMNKQATVIKYNGTTWNNIGAQGFSATTSAQHSIAVDSTGVPYLAYTDGGITSNMPASVVKFNGSSWVNVGIEKFSEGPVWSISFTIGNFGTPIIALGDIYNRGKATIMKYSSSSWVSVEQSGFSPGNAPYTSIAVDMSGTPYVAFQDINNSKKLSVLTYNGTTWSNAGTIITSSPAKNIQIVCNKLNELYVFYQIDLPGATGTIYAMKFFGGTWIPIPSPGVGKTADVSYEARFSRDDTLYVVLSDSTVSNKLSVKKFNASSWAYVGNAGFTSGTATKPSIDISPSGLIFVSYTRANYLYVSSYSSGSWYENLQTIVQSPNFSYLRISKSNKPYVYYIASNTAYLVQFTNGYWTPLMQGAISWGPTTKPSCIAFIADDFDNVYYTYSISDGSMNLQNKDQRLAIALRSSGGQVVSIGSYPNSFGAFCYPSLSMDTLGGLYSVFQDGGAIAKKFDVINFSPSSVTYQNVCFGDTAVFSLKANSGNSLTYQWQINSLNTGFVNLSDDNTFSGTSTSILTINNVTASLTAKEYRCIVADSCSSYLIPVILSGQAPFVSLSTLGIPDTICVSAIPYNFSGGSPSGGIYTGYNVTGNSFLADSTGHYKISYSFTDNSGCSATDSNFVYVEKASISALITEPSCGDTMASVALYGSGPAPFQYFLDTLQQFNNVFTNVSIIPNHTICMTNSFGCQSCTTVAIADSCDLVWPGDANDDLIVDNLDFLAIGIGNGSFNSPRDSSSTLWNGYPSKQWTQTLLGGANYKHIDCNGDSIITLEDTITVIQNYSLTRPNSKFGAQIIYPNSSASVPLKIESVADTILPGASGSLRVHLGDTVSIADSIYGIAFTIGFNPAIINPSSFYIETNNSWLGTTGADLMAFVLNDGVSGFVKCAVTRYDHINKSGNGLIGTIHYSVNTNFTGTQSVAFTLNNVFGVDSSGTPKSFVLSNDSIVALDPMLLTNQTFANNDIKIYPLPATDRIILEGIPIDAHINIYDITGQLIFSKKTDLAKLEISTDSFPSGIFFIEIAQENNKIYKRIVINR